MFGNERVSLIPTRTMQSTTWTSASSRPPVTHGMSAPSKMLRLRTVMQDDSEWHKELSPRTPVHVHAQPDPEPRSQSHRLWNSPLQALEETCQWSDKYIGKRVVPTTWSPRLSAVPTSGRPASAKVATPRTRPEQREAVHRPPVAGSVVYAVKPAEQEFGPTEWHDDASPAEETQLADASEAARDELEAAEKAAKEWWAWFEAARDETAVRRKQEEEDADEAAYRASVQRDLDRKHAEEVWAVERVQWHARTQAAAARIESMMAEQKAEYSRQIEAAQKEKAKAAVAAKSASKARAMQT